MSFEVREPQICWACGMLGPCLMVLVDEEDKDSGARFICKDECTWPESEADVLEVLSDEEFEGMNKLEVGDDEFAAWLNSNDPVKLLLVG